MDTFLNYLVKILLASLFPKDTYSEDPLLFLSVDDFKFISFTLSFHLLRSLSVEMSEDVTYSLKWKHFTSYRLSNVFEENCFTDVTLVSNDQKQFQAHRYVLSNFSPVLENILLSNPHSHPLIYLRGVHHQVLSSILQFIYLGKTKVNHSNMKRFAEVAKDLQIEKVADNI